MFSKYFVASPLHHLAATAAATLIPPFTRITLLKLSVLSTSAVKDRPNDYTKAENTCPMSDFFLNECGLCNSELSKILKKKPSLFTRRSTHRAQQVVRFLRDSGFTEDQVRKIITQNPSILDNTAERGLKPKIEFMKTLGLTAQDLGIVTSLRSRLLQCSIEKTLRPNIQYLQNLFGSEVDVSRVLKAARPCLHTGNGPEIWEKRLKHLASFGLLEDEIKELVRRHPFILDVSMEKVQKIMDFFIHTAGLPPKFLLQYPKILSYSLECRIKPRHKVLKYISAMQPPDRLRSLPTAISVSEQDFLKIYVKCSPYATKLLEMYSSKPVDLDSIQ